MPPLVALLEWHTRCRLAHAALAGSAARDMVGSMAMSWLSATFTVIDVWVVALSAAGSWLSQCLYTSAAAAASAGTVWKW